MNLRPYQQAAINEVKTLIRQGVRSILLQMPTGAGKTAVSSEMIRSSVDKQKHVIFLVHRREIVLDTSRRLRAADIRCGIVMPGHPPIDAFAQVCSIQTLVARGYKPKADVIWIDECHHTVAKTYREILSHYPKAIFIGLTATPERQDGTALGDIFERIVSTVTVRELTEAGFLAPVDVYAPAQDTRGRILNGVLPTLLAHRSEWSQGIVFVSQVAQAQEVTAELCRNGIMAACVHGKLSKPVRAKAFHAFKQGLIQIIVNVNVATEGTDLPSADMVCIARPVGHASLYLQMVGRCMRVDPMKPDKHSVLFDLCGAVRKFGLPDDDREYRLDGKPIRPKQDVLLITQCKVCGAVYRPVIGKPCPQCGTMGAKVDPPKTVTGKLEKVIPGAGWSAEKKKDFWERMKKSASDRGFKEGWAYYRYRSVVGDNPP